MSTTDVLLKLTERERDEARRVFERTRDGEDTGLTMSQALHQLVTADAAYWEARRAQLRSSIAVEKQRRQSLDVTCPQCGGHAGSCACTAPSRSPGGGDAPE